MIAHLDGAVIAQGDRATLDVFRKAAEGVGFFTRTNTVIPWERMLFVPAAYRAFFALPVGFREVIEANWQDARAVAMTLLRGLALAIGADAGRAAALQQVSSLFA